MYISTNTYLQYSTNIKTWLNDLGMVSKATEGINMSIMAVGAADYAKAIDGLTLSQAQLLLSLQGVDAEQQKHILLQAGLIASSDKMSAQLVHQALETTGLSVAERQQMMTELGLMDKKTKNLILTNSCTEAELRAQLTKRGYIGTAQDEIVTSILGTSVRGKEAISWDVLTGAIKRNIAAMLKWLVTNPIGQIGLIIASVGLLSKGYNALIGQKEKLADAKLEGLDEEISNLDSEIQSLESLQEKLKDAKGSKSELAKIQSELNDAIGDTPGLLNGEGKAYDIANAKLKAYIESKKQERDALKQDKIDASKDKFDNNSMETDKFLGFIGADVSADQMRDNAKEYQRLVDYYNSLSDDDRIKKKYENADDYVHAVWGRQSIDWKEWSDYWDEQVKVAYDAFDAVIEDYEGYGGQDFLKNMINDMVRDGADFTEISNAIQAVIDNDQMQEAINTYWESLVNPDIDSEKALENVKKAFDEMIKLYPGLEDFFDGVYERIIAGGNKVADTTEENANKMTVSIGDLGKASDGIKTLGSAFKEISDDGYITTKTLGEIKTAAGLADDEWAEYEATLFNAKKGSVEFNQAMSELTYKVLEHEMGAEKLANATEEQIAAVLRENGVLNANAVAESIVIVEKNKKLSQSTELAQAYLYEKIGIEELTKKTEEEIAALLTEGNIESTVEQRTYLLAQAKDALRIKTSMAKASTAEEVVALAMEASQAGITGNALNDLVLDMGVFNNVNLDVSQKVAALQELGYYAAWAGQSLANINSVKKQTVNGKDYIASYDKDGKLIGIEEEKQIEIPKVEVPKITIPNYGGATSGGGGGGGGGGSDKNEALDNHLKDAESRYKIHQDETMYINELDYALKNLCKTKEEELEIEEKIRDAIKARTDNQIKDMEHRIDSKKNLYGEDVDVTEDLNKIQQIASGSANEYREYMRGLGYSDEIIEATDEIQGWQKIWWDAQNSKLDSYNKQHENIIRDIEHARDMAVEQNPFTDTTSYYKQMQDEYHKEAERLRALDPEKYKEEIQKLQQDWWDAQEAIVDQSYSNSERWINERNTYNDWDLYGDNEVAAWERVLKRFQTEFPNELEKIDDIKQKILEARKNEMEKSISDIEDYITSRNTYNDWDVYGDSEVKAVQRITKLIEDEYEQRLISREEYIDKLEEQSRRIYSLAQDEIDKNMSNIDKYISARNHFDDWDEFGDSEIEAIKRQVQYLDEAYEQKLISYEEYTEKVAEYTQKMYSVAKDDIIEEVSELIEDYEEMKNLESSQVESQKTLLQSYYDVSNAVTEAQREIDKELKASMAMHEYLNEETRELLFNQEDYNALNEELLEIQTDADELQKQYREDILNANAETIAEITSHYQMQYETMVKQYEIAKAELEVAKKRQKLDNVLAERNTRMFINGQWQWVAKTQDVINAQNELADAEINRKKQEASLEQTEAINEFTEQINALDTDLKEIRKYWSDMQEMFNDESDEVAKALKQISEVSSPELQRVIKAAGGSVDSFSDSMSINTQTMSTVINENLTGVSLGVSGFITNLGTYSDAIKSLADKISGTKSSSSSSSTSDAAIKAQMAANSAAWHTASTQAEKDRLHDENVRLGEMIGLGEDDYDDVTGKWKYHADGTRYTPGGLTALGEKGFEAYITNNGRLIPISQPTIGNISAGGIVFNREQMANLRTLWDLSNLGKVTSFVSSSNMNKQNTTIDNSIHINGLTVSEQGNEDWINGLRRYVATHK